MFSLFDFVTHIFLIIKTYVAILAMLQHSSATGTYNEAFLEQKGEDNSTLCALLVVVIIYIRSTTHSSMKETSHKNMSGT